MCVYDKPISQSEKYEKSTVHLIINVLIEVIVSYHVQISSRHLHRNGQFSNQPTNQTRFVVLHRSRLGFVFVFVNQLSYSCPCIKQNDLAAASSFTRDSPTVKEIPSVRPALITTIRTPCKPTRVPAGRYVHYRNVLEELSSIFGMFTVLVWHTHHYNTSLTRRIMYFRPVAFSVK